MSLEEEEEEKFCTLFALGGGRNYKLPYIGGQIFLFLFALGWPKSLPKIH